jgi:hypothetical protein
MMSSTQITKLAKRRNCPRCSMQKTEGMALCRSCRFKLPPNMRMGLERISERDVWMVSSAIRAAANYFDVHFKSIRIFGGGRTR